MTVFPPEQEMYLLIVEQPSSDLVAAKLRTHLGRVKDDFNENDLVLGEYAATVIGMEILREKHNEVEKEGT